MYSPRILVLGGGGIGGLIASKLSAQGRDVTLADQWPEHVETVKERGMAVSEGGSEYSVAIRAVHIHELQAEEVDFDLIFLAVKSYDTDWTAALARRHVAHHGQVVVCQNGITDDRVAKVVGVKRTIGCVVTVAGALVEAGHVVRADSYPVGFRVGELMGESSERIRTVAELLNEVAVTKTTTELTRERWAKLATNCMVNALSGISGYSAGEVRSRDDTLPILVQLGAEAVSVGRAANGVDPAPIMGLPPHLFVDAAKHVGTAREQLMSELRAVAKATGAHRASMLQDVLRGRRTEIEDLNGLVVRYGNELGIPTPFNAAATDIVLRRCIQGMMPDPRNLAPLLRMAFE